MSDRKKLLKALREIAACKPGEQSLWDCTVAAWAADEIEELEKMHEAARGNADENYRRLQVLLDGITEENRHSEAFVEAKAERDSGWPDFDADTSAAQSQQQER